MTFSLKQSQITAQNSSNGGRFTRNPCAQTLLSQKVTAIASPHSDRWIKQFAFNAAETPEENVAISLDFPQVSPETAIYLATGTQRDTQADLSPARYYGIGKLTAGVSIGASQLSIQFPAGSAALNAVMAGDYLVLQSPVAAGVHADAEIETLIAQSVSWVADVATVVLTATIAKNWAINSTAASAITSALVTATLDNVVKTNCSITESAIVLTNNNTIEQTITLTFSSATAFTVISDAGITLASGNIASQYAPLNPATNNPYLTIPPTAWISATTGGTLVFQTHPAVVPIWTLARFFPGETDDQANAASLCISAF